MKESNWEYDQRMMEERHTLTTGGENRYSKALDIFYAWGDAGKPEYGTTEWEKFAKPFRIFKGAKCV